LPGKEMRFGAASPAIGALVTGGRLQRDEGARDLRS
jgi:hypothetical protein